MLRASGARLGDSQLRLGLCDGAAMLRCAQLRRHDDIAPRHAVVEALDLPGGDGETSCWLVAGGGNGVGGMWHGEVRF